MPKYCAYCLALIYASEGSYRKFTIYEPTLGSWHWATSRVALLNAAEHDIPIRYADEVRVYGIIAQTIFRNTMLCGTHLALEMDDINTRKAAKNAASEQDSTR